jgi:hypothetical protein
VPKLSAKFIVIENRKLPRRPGSLDAPSQTSTFIVRIGYIIRQKVASKQHTNRQTPWAVGDDIFFYIQSQLRPASCSVFREGLEVSTMLLFKPIKMK